MFSAVLDSCYSDARCRSPLAWQRYRAWDTKCALSSVTKFSQAKLSNSRLLQRFMKQNVSDEDI